MEQLVICKTVNGRFAVRPIGWAGIWNKNGELQNGCNRLAEFEIEQDAVDFVQHKSGAVDAVLVVRCRDCKSANVRDDMGEDFYECPQNGVTVFCNGGHFCGYGEPRTPPAE